MLAAFFMRWPSSMMMYLVRVGARVRGRVRVRVRVRVRGGPRR